MLLRVAADFVDLIRLRLAAFHVARHLFKLADAAGAASCVAGVGAAAAAAASAATAAAAGAKPLHGVQLAVLAFLWIHKREWPSRKIVSKIFKIIPQDLLPHKCKVAHVGVLLERPSFNTNRLNSQLVKRC